MLHDATYTALIWEKIACPLVVLYRLVLKQSIGPPPFGSAMYYRIPIGPPSAALYGKNSYSAFR